MCRCRLKHIDISIIKIITINSLNINELITQLKLKQPLLSESYKILCKTNGLNGYLTTKKYSLYGPKTFWLIE